MFPPIRVREAMNLGGLTAWELTVRTWRGINTHEIMTRAAAVAFYAMLALVPFLALVITMTARFLPDLRGLGGEQRGIRNMTADEFRGSLKSFFPTEAYKVVEEQLARLQDEKPPSFFWLMAGLAVTVWLASSLFVSVMDAMNRINGVEETRSLVRVRLVALVMTLIQAVILIGSLLVIVLWPQIMRWLGMTAMATTLATTVQWVVVTVMVLVSFALTFYVGPDSDQRWEWITPGSLIGALAFLAASFGFRIYVQYLSDYSKTYGSLGGVMVLLFWFWISALVILTAGQVNREIEEASPMGKGFGQKTDTPDSPDLKSLKPEPLTDPT